MGFAQVGQKEKTSAFVLLSSAVRADGMLSANEQIISFLFYIRLTVRADGSLNFPPAQSLGRCMPFMKTFIIIIGICLLTSCGSQSVDHYTEFKASFPDTSKTWAGRETRQDFHFTRDIENKFQLTTLTNGINNTEIRIWRLSGSYDPQSLNTLHQSGPDKWSLRTIEFYQTKSDSIIADYTTLIRDGFIDSLNLDRYWNMPSQSELTDGDKYGCMDGNNVLIELANSTTYKLKWYRCPDINKTKDSVFLLVSELISKLNAITENK